MALSRRRWTADKIRTGRLRRTAGQKYTYSSGQGWQHSWLAVDGGPGRKMYFSSIRPSMCVNYAPTRKEVIDVLVNVDVSGVPDWPAEVWQDYAAPIIRAGLDGEPELIVGTYG